MNDFDLIVERTKDALSVAGQKAGEFVEISKLRLHASKLKSRINNRYQRIGKLYFDQKELGISCEEKIEDACTEVYALKLELEWTLEKLDEAQDTRHCPHCGQFNPSAASYCNRCSKKL
ncbi:MAG: hypothetical protein E7486_02420 [Ruminococcaceae bacterium]|nr:hypothetical protein [Oscillospiraceae bacterium]